MAEPLFDPSLKKKKKKKTVAFNEDPLAGDADPTVPLSPQSPGPTIHEQTKLNGIEREADALKAEAKKEEARKEEEDELALLDGFKKKKKKKAIPMDLETMEQSSAPAPSQSESAAEVPSVDDFDLSDLKKKKKSSKKKAADLEAFEKELGDKEEGANGHDLGGEEELGEDPFENEGEAPAEIIGVDTGKEPWIGSDRDYRYPELLDRFFSALHAANPALASNMGKRYTIAPPQILREGNKKSIFANIPDICRRMHRQPEHVIAFMLAEMGTTGSVDGSGRLVIKGRFLQKQVENVLRRYIVEYVTCKTCKSPDTILTKENRIYFMACESCGSRRSVSTIKSGFQAQIGRRSKNKTT